MKKTILFLLTLISVSVTNAQIVNIPDPNFKFFLTTYSPTIDTNNDGEIQVTEAEAFTGDFFYDTQSTIPFNFCDCIQTGTTPADCYYVLYNVSNNIYDLTGLEAFKNVSTITFREVNLSSNVNINSIVLNNFNNLTSIEITFVSENLQYISIPTLDLSNNPNLRTIDFISQPSYFNNCLDYNGVNYDLLTDSNINFPYVTVMFQNVLTNNLPLLESLKLYNFSIPSINVLQSPNLIDLYIPGNNLTSLDVSNNPNLNSLRVGSNNLTTLDVSNNTNLTSLRCNNNNSLTYLNLKNGNNANFNLNNSFYSNFTNLPLLETVCVDDINNTSFTNYILNEVGHSVSFSENCTLAVLENTFLNFSVYPTPTENILNIKSKTEIVKVEFYSKLGQLIKETTENKIDISNLTQGLYFVKVEDVNGNFGVKKVVKK